MQIWIDGDACPKVIKELIFRAGIRTKTNVLVVANQSILIPPSPFIKKFLVGAGFDVADKYIVDNMQSGDLVITADIPLADAAITKGGFALNPRGEMYTASNVKQRLAIRDLNETLRSCNLISGGPPKFTAKEVRDFANNLDRFITSRNKNL